MRSLQYPASAVNLLGCHSPSGIAKLPKFRSTISSIGPSRRLSALWDRHLLSHNYAAPLHQHLGVVALDPAVGTLAVLSLGAEF